MRTLSAVCLGLVMAGSVGRAGEIAFAAKPAAARAGDRVKISFAMSAPTDVEVTVLDSAGKVVRHLAAGVLGGEMPPPEPLKAGLSQTLEWNMNDDFGKPAAGGPFKVRVSAGTGVKLDGFIGADPYNFGGLCSIAADEEGNVYAMGFAGEANQGHLVIRVFDPQGRYRREILPFPADLPPDAMKDVARWDADRKTFFPRNLKNLNPDFYGGKFTFVSASVKNGVVLTNGSRIFTLDSRGAVKGESFVTTDLWPPKGALPNTGNGPTHLTASPDGKYMYLSGPYSSNTAYGHKADPRFPPGQVYRMEVGKGTMENFAKLQTIGENPAKPGIFWCSKNIAAPGNYVIPHGPIHDVAVDKAGNVYIADQDNQRVAVFGPDGRELGAMQVPYPDRLAVHPATGAVYVVTKEIQLHAIYKKKLLKFSGWKDARQEAEYDLGTDRSTTPSMALSAGKGRTVVWISGVTGNVLALEDKGAGFEKLKTGFDDKKNLPLDWNRLATDYARDEVYMSNGTTRVWRFDGKTGAGGVLRKDGKDFLVNDLAVGYDGLLYVRVSGAWDNSSGAYSGPFWRLTREMEPAPYAGTGTHILSNYLYSRFGIGFAERGIAPGPDGKVYVSFMYTWVNYCTSGFGPDGKPLQGKYLKGKVAKGSKGYTDKAVLPADLDSAIIGPITAANGGLRVGLDGNIYIGLWAWPKDLPAPKEFEKDSGYLATVGSVAKFTPEGGFLSAPAGWGGSDGVIKVDPTPGAKGFEVRSGRRGIATFHQGFLEGAVKMYPGLAPFSHDAFGGNNCCVCRVPRFDIDRHGRLAIPNAVTNSVRLVDNAGNLIVEFGKYGNFDSQFVNENVEAGTPKKPSVAIPEIPMTWPTGAGFTAEHLYVNDTYSRRVLRLDLTHAAEETAEVK